MGATNQKKMVLLVFGLLFLFFGMAMGKEQEQEDDQIDKFEKFIMKKRVNAAYFIVGNNTFRLNSLNNYLTPRGFPTLAANYLAYGFGGHVIHNKFVLGAEVQRSFGKKQLSTANFNTFLSFKYTTLNIGYLLYSQKGLMTYPLLGFGFGELKLKVMNNEIDSFNDIDKNHNISTSWTHSFLVNLGMGLDYFVNFNKKMQGKNNLVIGIRAGYLISPIKFNWSIDGIRVGDGPEVGLTGPYIRITIGLGGWVEKLIKQAI